MTPNLDDVKNYLIVRYGIRFGEALTLGNVVSSIFRITKNGKKLVAKIGLTETESAEVERNRIGYREMRNIGAAKLLPDSLEYLSFRGVPILIMEDLGSDFWHAARESSDPIRLYHRLCEEMLPIYAATTFRGSSVGGTPNLGHIVSLINGS